MTEFEIVVPKYADEPPQRKQKVESSSSVAPIESYSRVEPDSWDDDYIDPAVEAEYERQVLESDGFDVEDFRHLLPYGGIIPQILKDKLDYPYDIGVFGRLGLHCYNLQKATNLKLIGINKYNSEMTGDYVRYITLEAMDTSNNNSTCVFQTLVCKCIAPDDASLMVETQLSRLRVPVGPQKTFIGMGRRSNR